MPNPLDYTIGWICAIQKEYTAAQAFLEEKHPVPQSISQQDPNTYTLGRMGNHNVVIVVLPQGDYGVCSAATVTSDMCYSFPNITMGLMVGIGGGVPSRKKDVRLGDVVVSTPGHGHGGVIRYNLRTALQDPELEIVEHLNAPPPALLQAMVGLKTEYRLERKSLGDSIDAVLDKHPKLRQDNRRPENSLDRLYRSDGMHAGNGTTPCTQSCDDVSQIVARPERSNPSIHYGIIASDNVVCKDARIRDKLAANGVLCIEMEAAGLMNHFPCVVIRGIADYADIHKNDEWHGYAAFAAAAYAKELLRHVPTKMQNRKGLVGSICSYVSSGFA
ncbi:hypothetical protein NW768_010245 [Fusarium equiseti]|uniref:Nucleoside phosphorylase domain-containing protein n=1 Tax=Fusarium equiseti TaxID=61235 RepID=A0ABQ8R195_FUSEQ|nr:hypothetical protein NW768_010245 [Fusarium equiseti]